MTQQYMLAGVGIASKIRGNEFSIFFHSILKNINIWKKNFV
jgi:hypothetical protein